jgi:hypothetical protein
VGAQQDLHLALICHTRAPAHWGRHDCQGPEPPWPPQAAGTTRASTKLLTRGASAGARHAGLVECADSAQPEVRNLHPPLVIQQDAAAKTKMQAKQAQQAGRLGRQAPQAGEGRGWGKAEAQGRTSGVWPFLLYDGKQAPTRGNRLPAGGVRAGWYCLLAACWLLLPAAACLPALTLGS